MTPGPAFLDRRRHITSDVMMSLFLGIPANYLYGGGVGRNDIYFKSIIFLLVETRKVYSLGIYFPTTFLSFPYLIPHYSLSF